MNDVKAKALKSHPLDYILKNAVAMGRLEPDTFDAMLHRNIWFAFDQEQPLFHYIKLEYFKNLLDCSSLRFGRLDLYPDTYEGRFPAANFTRRATVTENLYQKLKIKDDPQAMVESQNIARKYSYVHCWFGQNTESKQMWERYGDSGRGICIRSSTSRIRRALKPHGLLLDVHWGKVTYSEETTPISTLFSMAPAFRKHPDYRAESEYRLLAQIRLGHEPTDTDGFLAPAPEFQLVPVCLIDLIEEVLIGPRRSVDEIQEVFELMDRQLKGVRVNGSRFWRPTREQT